MNPNHVDPEEMAKRQDLDLIASLNMIGEGGPAPKIDDEKIEKKEPPTVEN
ncbi:hypothetical protein [Psychrobacillus vulpis]|uniref:hypothetical protein n=1 Tax=Psychrobacillus vulpis TaxID=2325572 RepID=UPI00140AC512|nr:hypothetical protein [Psychrobacillus vulpis]